MLQVPHAPAKEPDRTSKELRRKLWYHLRKSKQAECLLESESKYGPARGRRIQAVVKVHAHNVGPSSLPRNAALVLGSLLAHRLSRPLLVLGGAVRYGCVTLQVDAHQPHGQGHGREDNSQCPQPGAPQGTSQGSTGAGSAQQQAQDDPLFMGAVPDVVSGWLGNAQVSEHLEPGTLMHVQVGDSLQRFMWSAPNWVQVDSPAHEAPSIDSSAYSLSVGFPVAVLPSHEGGHGGVPSREGGIVQQQEQERLPDPSLVAEQQQGEEGEKLLLELTTVVGLQPGQQLVGWVSDQHEAEAAAQRGLQHDDSTVRLLARWQGSHVPLSVCAVEEIEEITPNERVVKTHLQLQLPPRAAQQPSVLLLELWSSSDILLAPAAEMLLLPSQMAGVARELRASLLNQQHEQPQSSTAAAGVHAHAHRPDTSPHGVQFSREGAAEFLSDLTDWMRGIDTHSARAPSSVTDFSSELYPAFSGNITAAAELTGTGSSAPVLACNSNSAGCSATGNAAEGENFPPHHSISNSLSQLGWMGQERDSCGSSKVNGEGSVLSAALQSEVLTTLAQSQEQQLEVLTALGRDLLQQAVVWGMPALADTLLQGLLGPPCGLSFEQLANGGTHAQQHARGLQDEGEGPRGGGVRGDSGGGSNGGQAGGGEGDESSSPHSSEPLLGLALRSRSEAMLAQVLAWGHTYAAPSRGPAPSSVGTQQQQQQQQQQQGVWDWHAMDSMGVSSLMLAQSLLHTHPWLIDMLEEDTHAGPSMLQAWLSQQPDPGLYPSHTRMSAPPMPPLSIRQLCRIAVYLVLLLRCTIQGFDAPRGGQRGGLLRAVREARARMYGLQPSGNDEDSYRDADTPQEKLAEDNFCRLKDLHNLNVKNIISYVNITMGLLGYAMGAKEVGFIPQLRHLPLYTLFVGSNLVRMHMYPFVHRWHVRCVDIQWLCMCLTVSTMGPSTGCMNMLHMHGDASCAVLYAFMDLVPVVPFLLWRVVSCVASVPLYTVIGFEAPWSRAFAVNAAHAVLGVAFLCWHRHKALTVFGLSAGSRR